MESDCRILVFAKAPTPGAAKTRLIPMLGAERASRVYRTLIEHTLKSAVASGIGPVELWCAPDCNDAFLRSCADASRATLHVQADGDLGDRMAHAVQRALRASRAAVLIGTDCAVLGARHIQAAAMVLAAGKPAVFCPAEDGGYALIGLARYDPTLFRDLRWGEATVMECTRKRLRALNWTWLELETLWDIDRPEDYHRLCSARLPDVVLP